MPAAHIFFGTAADFPVSFKAPEFKESLAALATRLQLEHLTLNYQTHSTDGFVIDHGFSEKVDYKTREGDYLITQRPGMGIAMHTADCLPLIFYAADKEVIAAAHAGWRGSVAGIGPIVVGRLVQEFGVDPSTLKVWFGPAGKACCYEVQADFVAPSPDLIKKHDGKLFFDNMALNRQQLITVGVKPENIDDSKNDCTICNTKYHSYRRAEDKSLYNTQATIVWLTT